MIAETCLELTCWRGLCVSHPADWELAVTSAPGAPARCSFMDRVQHRMDLRWRPVRAEPNLDRMLDAYRRVRTLAPAAAARGAPDDNEEINDLRNAPAPWRGLVRSGRGRGVVVHAGRYFSSASLLVEAMLVWPAGRDEELERRILGSVSAQDPLAPRRRWRAMGLDLEAPRDLELSAFEARVGQVRWTFRSAGGDRAELVVERTAQPRRWLHEPLQEWLGGQLPRGSRLLSQETVAFNGHAAPRIDSLSWAGVWASLRGAHRLRTDLAWECESLQRLYRIAYTRVATGREAPLPKDVCLKCCGETS